MAGKDDKALIDAAKKTLADCKTRWDSFRKDSGQTLDNYVDQSSDYLTNILNDTSTPKDWFKGGIALWIQSYGTARRIWSSAYNLVYPHDDNQG